jgi:hypothetical protein
MSFFDFNTASPQNDSDLIPKGTLCKVCMVIRYGKAGGIVTTADSGWEYLQAEMTLTSAPWAKRKIFQNIGVGGTTDGHKKSAEISRSLLRAMLESARNINPKDETPAAVQARQINGWDDLQELEFAIEVGVDKQKPDSQYQDRNKIQKVICPGHKDYARIMSGETIIPDGSAKPAPSAPSWEAAPPVSKPQAGNAPGPVPSWAS